MAISEKKNVDLSMNLTYSSTPTFSLTQWKVLDNVKIVENEEKQIQVKKGKWKFDKDNKKISI